jgi:hypothetical protein
MLEIYSPPIIQPQIGHCLLSHIWQTLKTSLKSAVSIWQHHQIQGPEVASTARYALMPLGLGRSHHMLWLVPKQVCCLLKNKGLVSRHNCLLCLFPFQALFIYVDDLFPTSNSRSKPILFVDDSNVSHPEIGYFRSCVNDIFRLLSTWFKSQ